MAQASGPAECAGPIGIVLCADDYGIAPGVGQAIRHLLSLGRLSATSCMVVSPYWPAEAEALKPFAERADVGLHLTLTDQRALGPMPRTAPGRRLPKLLRLAALAFAGRLARDEIKAELTRQLDAFETAFGRPPAHLDGHQHVHQLPVVRDVVLELYAARLARHGVYLRYCTEPARAILARRVHVGEAFVIDRLARRFARVARAAGIPGNRRFSGVHDFAGRIPYRELFDAFLEAPEPGLLVICHPGISDAALVAADRVTLAREDEYRYFLSDAFLESLRTHRVAVTRLASINVRSDKR